MSICGKCKNKICLTTGEPCNRVNKLLPSPTHGRLHGETQFSNFGIDTFFYYNENGEVKKTERRRKKVINDE